MSTPVCDQPYFCVITCQSVGHTQAPAVSPDPFGATNGVHDDEDPLEDLSVKREDSGAVVGLTARVGGSPPGIMSSSPIFKSSALASLLKEMIWSASAPYVLEIFEIVSPFFTAYMTPSTGGMERDCPGRMVLRK